jgi:hypothetical protein
MRIWLAARSADMRCAFDRLAEVARSCAVHTADSRRKFCSLSIKGDCASRIAQRRNPRGPAGREGRAFWSS